MAAQLRSRSSEINRAIFARVEEAVPAPLGDKDPAYQAGVREAITALVEYSLEGIERGPGWTGPIPLAAVSQARLAARTGVSLGTVLRRYVAGHGELGEIVTNEAQHCGLSGHGSELHDIRRTQEALLEHLTAAIEREYLHELGRIARSPEQRRAQIVHRLLAGEPVEPTDLAELDYELHTSWHLGMIATGPEVADFLRGLKAHYARRLLGVSLEGSAWAWLGGQKPPVVKDIERLSTDGYVGLAVGVGEPGRGIDGLRLTHDQAQDALRVALRRPDRFACYADHRLLAAAVSNDTLVASLKQKYLLPLGSQRDGGATLRRTLRTYIDLECNATSAAHELNVGRRSVKSRIRTAEGLIGCALGECLAELDVALRLDELDRAASANDAPPDRPA
jgi:hypothetical protein